MADFRNHAGAGDGFGDHLWHPFTAAHGASRALYSNLANDAGIAGVGDAFFDDGAWDTAGLGHPFATAFLNGAAFGDGLADGVAHVLEAGLGFRLP